MAITRNDSNESSGSNQDEKNTNPSLDKNEEQENDFSTTGDPGDEQKEQEEKLNYDVVNENTKTPPSSSKQQSQKTKKPETAEPSAEMEQMKENYRRLEEMFLQLKETSANQIALLTGIGSGGNNPDMARAIATTQQAYDPEDELKESVTYFAYAFRKSIDCYSIAGKLVPNPLGRMVHFEPFATYQEGGKNGKDGNRIPICRAVITSKKEQKWLEGSAGIEFGVTFFRDTNNIMGLDFEEEIIKMEAADRMKALTVAEIIARAKNEISSGNTKITMTRDVGQLRLQMLDVFMKEVRQQRKENKGKINYSLQQAIDKAEEERRTA